MIINIKGCSGSGKSTIVRKIMELYENKEALFIEGRKRPIGYKLWTGNKALFIVGHYETACGGCDTIKLMDDVFNIIRQRHERGYDVIFEGLLLTADVNRSVALVKDGLPLLTIGLSTPLELCLESINTRRHDAWVKKFDAKAQENKEREAKGLKLRLLPERPEPVNPYHTTNKWKQMKNVMRRIKEAGLRAEDLDRDETLRVIKKELGL